MNLREETDRLLAKADELGATFQRQSASHSGVRAVEGSHTHTGEEVADELRDLEGAVLDHVCILAKHVKVLNKELRRLSVEVERAGSTRNSLHEPELLDGLESELHTLTEVTYAQRAALLEAIRRAASTLHRPLEAIWGEEPAPPPYPGRGSRSDSIEDLLDK